MGFISFFKRIFTNKKESKPVIKKPDVKFESSSLNTSECKPSSSCYEDKLKFEDIKFETPKIEENVNSIEQVNENEKSEKNDAKDIKNRSKNRLVKSNVKNVNKNSEHNTSKNKLSRKKRSTKNKENSSDKNK